MNRALLWFFVLFASSLSQARVGFYAGAIGGVSTLSADAGTSLTSRGLNLSAYSPQNGGALNVFFGAHFHNYFSAQANYVWNANHLVLSSTSPATNSLYQQARSSTQQAVVLDFLVYFRRRGSRVRPYLGTGAGVARFSSTEERLLALAGTPDLPPAVFSSLRPVFRSHVGIDVRMARHLDFRYSFSETLRANDISGQLSPPAPRRLANFQNLFGFVVRF